MNEEWHRTKLVNVHNHINHIFIYTLVDFLLCFYHEASKSEWKNKCNFVFSLPLMPLII